MVEQGTHKPLVASSNLALGTPETTHRGGLFLLTTKAFFDYYEGYHVSFHRENGLEV